MFLVLKKLYYLDTILVPGRLSAAFNNVDEIKIAVFLTDSTLMRSFLKESSVYRRFIKVLSRTARCFNYFVQKDKKLDWLDPTTWLCKSLIRWNSSWWNLLRWPFCSHTNHILSTAMQWHMHWELSSLIRKTTTICMSGLGLAIGAGQSIKRNKTTLQPKGSAMLWYKLSSHCPHTLGGQHLKFERITSAKCMHSWNDPRGD